MSAFTNWASPWSTFVLCWWIMVISWRSRSWSLSQKRRWFNWMELTINACCQHESSWGKGNFGRIQNVGEIQGCVKDGALRLFSNCSISGYCLPEHTKLEIIHRGLADLEAPGRERETCVYQNRENHHMKITRKLTNMGRLHGWIRNEHPVPSFIAEEEM